MYAHFNLNNFTRLIKIVAQLIKKHHKNHHKVNKLRIQLL
jgi:hypothetical protein